MSRNFAVWYARVSQLFTNSFCFGHSLYLTDFHRVGNPQLRSRKDWREKSTSHLCALRVPAPPQWYSSAGRRQCLSASEGEIDRLVCRLSDAGGDGERRVSHSTERGQREKVRLAVRHPPTRDITSGCIWLVKIAGPTPQCRQIFPGKKSG